MGRDIRCLHGFVESGRDPTQPLAGIDGHWILHDNSDFFKALELYQLCHDLPDLFFELCSQSGRSILDRNDRRGETEAEILQLFQTLA